MAKLAQPVDIAALRQLIAPCVTSAGFVFRSYGFDPLGLASPADLRDRFQESELIHSRWAMAGVAGALAVELLGQGNWITAQTWVGTFDVAAGTIIWSNSIDNQSIVQF